MLKKTLIATVVTATLFTAACNDKAETTQPGLYPVKGEVVATVNGVEITQPQLDEYTTFRTMNGQPSLNPVEELVNLEILRQAAVAAKMDQDSEVRASMSRAATNALANSLVKKQISTEVTDADLQAEYDHQVAEMKSAMEGQSEYNASHILLETEEEAVAVIEELKAGADFAELAKAKSTGPSGPEGGELGWNSADTFVPEFSAAMISLEAGEITEAPVQTQFGYHVIKLLDKRAAEMPEPPALDMVKDQIRNVVLQERMKTFMEGLRDAAKVEFAGAEAQAEEISESANVEAAEEPAEETVEETEQNEG